MLTVSTNVYLKLVVVQFMDRICESGRLHLQPRSAGITEDWFTPENSTARTP